MTYLSDKLIDKYAQRLSWAAQTPHPDQEFWRELWRELVHDWDRESDGCEPYNVLYDDNMSQPEVFCTLDDIIKRLHENPKIVSIQGGNFIANNNGALYRKVHL
jgi:hypothetical protein